MYDTGGYLVRGGFVISAPGEESRLVPVLGSFSANIALPNEGRAGCAVVGVESDTDLVREACISKSTLQVLLGTESQMDTWAGPANTCLLEGN